ncbi:DUF2877 domain-containing protein [Caballeronia zhejiangensis]|uniref:DUF2877 domain-containing protein n=1 Tax=Caballeronia zhejiangensis TaxID=871203 RepID=A0A656QFZ9_9BURK|nr:DUF2877 domain-containing protein [Caballeronia zhejiangensis]KDR27729.1 hypothetical protein BG60_16500 [Caballeronia zhejiangensis]
MSPITLRGLSIGYLARPGLSRTGDFAVHSSFRHALNLVAQTGDWFTLVDAACENLSCGARVSAPPGWDWRDHARPGERVAFSNGRLTGATWQADLTGAACWQPALQSGTGVRMSPDALSARHERVAARLAAHCARHAVAGALQWLPGWPAHARAVRLSPYDDPATLAATVHALVGLGGGLTPDGDDYLLGYLAAIWAALGDPQIDVHRHVLSTELPANLHRTNDISRHYLQLALDGHFNEPVDRFIAIASAADESADIEHAADAVMRWGASSGVDCLGGILHGMRAWRETIRMREAKSLFPESA